MLRATEDWSPSHGGIHDYGAGYRNAEGVEHVLTAQSYEDVRNRTKNESKGDHGFSEQMSSDREEREKDQEQSAEFIAQNET